MAFLQIHLRISINNNILVRVNLMLFKTNIYDYVYYNIKYMILRHWRTIPFLDSPV